MLGQTISRLLGKSAYHPFNTIEISKKNLLFNYRYLSKINPQIKIAPVLKSNAYGHGLVEIAKILDSAPFFCVDSLYEAYELLKEDLKTAILVMGHSDPENLKVKKLPFSWSVSDLKTLQVINEFQEKAGAHIFVDTGMNREGVPLEQLPTFLKYLERLPNIKVEGLMSHLATPEDSRGQQTATQIKNFQKARKIVLEHGLKPRWCHLLATKSILQKRYSRLGKLTNVARVGMGLLGIDPLGKDQNLKPVLSLKTKIAEIKRIKKGSLIGYSATYKAKKDILTSILPIGYFDGVDRRLSNKGFVLVQNIACPIIGIVSMNITTVDITNVPNPKIGDEVVVFSNNPNDLNSIQNSAKLCKTIPYELLVHLHPSTKRVIL